MPVDFALQVSLPGHAPTLIPLPAEGRLLIGREAPADVILEDSFLSRSHLLVECRRGLITATDAGSSNGTFINGLQLRQSVLIHGDAICVGQSFLRLTALMDGRPVLSLLGAAAALRAPMKLLAAGIEETCPFVLLDSAISPAVLEVLKGSGAFFQSLYEGETAVAIAPYGPFLVDLKASPYLLSHLIQRGWGEAWGVFLKTAQSFEQLRRHLRTLLLVKGADGKTLLFRFYDPRVLAIFLRTAEAEQRRQFFGEIEGFVLEGAAKDEVLFLTPGGEERVVLQPS